MNKLFWKLYNTICGSETKINILHFQYLSTYYLIKDLKEILPKIKGKVIDFGCGSQPYKHMLSNTDQYIGIDVADSDGVDIVCKDGVIPHTGEIDAVISTQVLEHVEDTKIYEELFGRVVAGGIVVISVPFMYQVHDRHDYRRYTAEGLRQWIESNGFRTTELKQQGGIGSTITALILSWLDRIFSKNSFTKLLKPLLLPFFLILSFVLNILGLLFDKIDSTESFYNNVLIVAEKQSDS